LPQHQLSLMLSELDQMTRTLADIHFTAAMPLYTNNAQQSYCT